MRPVAFLTCMATLAGAQAAPAAAQLRPLGPLDWSVFDSRFGSASVGGGVFSGQRASLAGTEGTLTELGTVTLSVHFDRVVLQLHGTALRMFSDDTVFAPPVGNARAPDGTRRYDTGDHQVQTVVRLSPSNDFWDLGLRFGVRLPTTDNLTGLERDQTDFFTTVAGRLRSGRLAVSGEIGVGIYGTRDSSIEQVDPLLYAGAVHYQTGPVTTLVQVYGQHDTRPSPPFRGLEDLGEVRLGVQAGNGRWVRLAFVRGWEEFSPDYGLALTVGAVY